MPLGTPHRNKEARATTPGRRTSMGTRKGGASPAPKGKAGSATDDTATTRAAADPAAASAADHETSDSAVTSASRVTVAVRVRPTDAAKTIMRFGPRQENALRFCHLDGSKSDSDAKGFSYDHVFDQSDSQRDVYETLGPKVLQQVVNGYNASVFAYGQTVCPAPFAPALHTCAPPTLMLAPASHAHALLSRGVLSRNAIIAPPSRVLSV